MRASHGAPTFNLAKVGEGFPLFTPSAEAVTRRTSVADAQLKDLAQQAAANPAALDAYLSQLALLSPAEIADFAARYPYFAHLPLPVSTEGKGNATVVRDWWNVSGSQEFGLSAEQREALIEQMPGFVGNLEGVRYADRDRANRLLLDFYIEHPEATTSHAQVTLERIRQSLGEQNGVPRSLLNLDLTNMQVGSYMTKDGVQRPLDDSPYDDVLISLAYGDVDSAQNITIFNPGMLNHPYVSLNPQDSDMAGMGQAIYVDQGHTYTEISTGTNRQSHAVIVNLNYITPQGADVLSMKRANVASDRNANAVDALNVLAGNVTAESQQRKVYLWNHSYGSTVGGQTIRKVETPR